MSATGIFTVGRDGGAVLSVSGYGNVTLPLATTIRITPRYKKTRSEPLNGPPIEASLPDGWDWEISMDRGSRVVDDLLSSLEAAFWGGGTLPQANLTQYIKENDGSTSTYATAAGSLQGDPGQFSGDSAVKQKLMGFAPTRRKVS